MATVTPSKVLRWFARSRWQFLGAIGICCLVASGCTGSSSGASSSDAHSEMPTHTSVSTLNGQVPPGRVAALLSVVPRIDTLNAQGDEVKVFRDTRAPQTRTPIHTHPLGGTTCVLEGEMTLYLEGSPPSRAVAGDCYYMPSGKPMAGFNSGTTNAIFLDSFIVPQGTSPWIVDEPAQSGTSDQFE